MKIPDPEVERVFWDYWAVTGMTPALQKAYERLPILLSMKPQTVEAYMKSLHPQSPADGCRCLPGQQEPDGPSPSVLLKSSAGDCG